MHLKSTRLRKASSLRSPLITTDMSGAVPAITFGGPDVPPDQPSPESFKLRESLSIIEWVADQHPNSTLLSKDPLARYKIHLFIETFSSTIVPGFYSFVFREGDPGTLLKAFETVQELLPKDTKYAVSNDFTNADVAAAPFVGRLEAALRNDVGIFALGEGKKVYDLLTKDAKFERLWKYFVVLKERSSFKETFPEVSDPVSALKFDYSQTRRIFLCKE